MCFTIIYEFKHTLLQYDGRNYFVFMKEFMSYKFFHVFSTEKENPILLEEERKCKRKKEKVFFGEAGIDQFFFCT